MEGREMQWHIGSKPRRHPFAKSTHLLRRIVLAWNKQGGDLKPCLRLVFDVDERIEHSVKRARAELLVEALGECLKIDIGGIHRCEELWSRNLANVARGHGDSPQSDFPAGSRNIVCIR